MANFRTFQPPSHEDRPGLNGYGLQGRPNSQPSEQPAPRRVEERQWMDAQGDRFATFRPMPEMNALMERREMEARHVPGQLQNGHGLPMQPNERLQYRSPQLDRDRAPQNPFRFQHGNFGAPIQDEQAPVARPPFLAGPDPIRESIESRPFRDIRYDIPRSSPPLSDFGFDRARNGFIDRPMTFEEHQRLEAMQREEQQRKESEGSGHRSVFNISPELNRKGRNSPLPQAVQGAQPRHVGPGGDNPGIKMEFGRMFSGLGSGVGTATPTAGQSVNGTTTPSRLSPPHHLQGGDLVRTAVAEIEEGRGSGKTGSRGGKRNSRRHREDDTINGIGRDTPDHQRGNKRSKNSHHHHHHVHPHHHHHHEAVDNGPSPFNLLRFPSNPLSHQNVNANAAHLHHHHHAHPGHHHHHQPRSVPPPRKPTTTVMSHRLIEECAKKPRKHLGSQLYTSETSRFTSINGSMKLNAEMKPIPYFEGKENCTYTVRVPRWYLSNSAGQEESYLKEICKLRQLWGTDVYTDDSDVVAAAVHSGWLKGDFGEHNTDLREVCGNESELEDDQDHDVPSMTLTSRPRKPVRTPPEHEAHITVVILPPLDAYASTNQHHIWSRDWKGTHDGMSFMIERIEFVDEGSGSRTIERTAAGRKQRLKMEEAKRKEAAAGLLLFANGSGEVVQAAA